MAAAGCLWVVSSLIVGVVSVFAGPDTWRPKAALDGLCDRSRSPGSRTGSPSRRSGISETATTAGCGYRDVQCRFGRGAQPDDIASAIVFLCGPHAGYITSITFHVNGGTHFGC